ncbi:MAG: universal stress protein [Timaviella obliquedivisa GSE-PSE-MK23-08B]|jgi:nucleotide-binding universal stress UspA family protein|nr:universal stress protein [Timaviella obliquedivisa GSE-PSE-MK23-08B]
MLYKILVAVDESFMNRGVFEEALDLSRKTGASLMLLHVLTPEERHHPELPRSYVPYYYPIVTDELLQQYQAEWEIAENRGLNLLRSLAQEATGVTVEFTQNIGNPGRVICDVAKDWGATLIVMGRRGRTGLSELLMGSVSNYVIHHAPCSVFVVQGKVQAAANVTPEENTILAASVK